MPGILPELARREVQGLHVEPPSLEELFLRHYGDDLDAFENGNGDDTTESTRANRRAARR